MVSIYQLCGAISTPVAFIEINIPGFLPDEDCEVALFPFDAFYSGAGVNLDIDMPADLDQFWRYDSHGAIIGGECLVQCTHDAANGG